MKQLNLAAAVTAAWSAIGCYLNTPYRPYKLAGAFNINSYVRVVPAHPVCSLNHSKGQLGAHSPQQSLKGK